MGKDQTYKNLLDDGYTTYHSDGSKSVTYKNMLDNGVTTYHSDGSKSTTYKHMLDNGVTTYHSDGSRSQTYKHVLDDGYSTYHSDGSRTESYATRNILDNGYTTRSYTNGGAGYIPGAGGHPPYGGAPGGGYPPYGGAPGGGYPPYGGGPGGYYGGYGGYSHRTATKKDKVLNVFYYMFLVLSLLNVGAAVKLDFFDHAFTESACQMLTYSALALTAAVFATIGSDSLHSQTAAFMITGFDTLCYGIFRGTFLYNSLGHRASSAKAAWSLLGRIVLLYAICVLAGYVIGDLLYGGRRYGLVGRTAGLTPILLIAAGAANAGACVFYWHDAYYRYGNMEYPYVITAVISFALVAGIALLVWRRKRNPALFVFLAAHCAWTGNHLFMGTSFYAPLQTGNLYFLAELIALMALAAGLLLPKESAYCQIIRSFWWLPGVCALACRWESFRDISTSLPGLCALGTKVFFIIGYLALGSYLRCEKVKKK